VLLTVVVLNDAIGLLNFAEIISRRYEVSRYEVSGCEMSRYRKLYL